MGILVITVDLQCCRCRNKITKVLNCLQDDYCIEKIEYEDKNDKVIVRGKFDAGKLCQKVWCKAAKVVKDIIIVDVWPPPKPCTPCEKTCEKKLCEKKKPPTECKPPPPPPPPPPPKPVCKLVPYPYPVPYPCQSSPWNWNCPPQPCYCCPPPPPPPPPPKPKPCECSNRHGHGGCGCGGKPPPPPACVCSNQGVCGCGNQPICPPPIWPPQPPFCPPPWAGQEIPCDACSIM